MIVEVKVKIATPKMKLPALLLLAAACCAPIAYGQAPCALRSTSPSVTICTPANGAITTSPVNVVAGSTDTAHPVTLMQIYVDGVTSEEVSGSTISASIPVATGSHRLTVQARDSSGLYFRTTANITVTSTTTGSISSIKHIVLLVQENR